MNLQLLKRLAPLWLRRSLRPFVYRLELWARARRLRALYRQVVRTGDLVFDVGAHLGEHSRHFLSLGASVVAVEPLKECWDTLAAMQNKYPRLYVYRRALGFGEGPAFLSTSSVPAHATMRPGHQAARFPGERFYMANKVHVGEAARLVDLHGLPDFVKIDVEGMEQDVIRGLRDHRPRFVSFEFNGLGLAEARTCAALLSPAVFNVTLFENHRFEFREWVQPHDLFQHLEARLSPYLCGDIFARLM